MSRKKFSHIVALIALTQECSVGQAIHRAQLMCGVSVTDLVMMYGKEDKNNGMARRIPS